MIDVLANLFRIRGVPQAHPQRQRPGVHRHRRSGVMAEQAGVETLYVEPGSPWENGYAESFHSRLRDELTEPRGVHEPGRGPVRSADAWRLEYNHRATAQFAGLPDPGGVCRRRAAASAPAAPTLQQQHSRNPETSHYPLPNPYSHNPWYRKRGHSKPISTPRSPSRASQE